MALITCPECGGKVSDTVENCIHCGFKIEKHELKQNGNICKINGIDYDLTLVIETMRKNKKDYAQKEANALLKDLTGLKSMDCGRLLFIILKLDRVPPKFNNGDNWKQYEMQMRKCPKCGSKDFIPVRKNWSLFAGFSTNKVDMVCSKCGTIIK